MRKQIDPRIHHLITNSIAQHQRSFIVLVGDRSRDQIPNLHYLLTQSGKDLKRPNVLWCYKKELGFTSHRKSREAKIKRDVKRGIREVDERNPFEVFVGVTDIRYCYYKETDKILGHTYGMLILQDFEALTPNLLARTIETVQGGGLVVLMLKTMASLRQVYTMSMDAHSRFASSSKGETRARFNERFILSLAASPSCLVLDDELNVLPISKGKDIQPLPAGSTFKDSQADIELKSLKDDLKESKPAGPLVSLAKTTDQARAVLQFIDALMGTGVSSVVTLTAARGRGKSAALGLALAAAVGCGYANIYVTSPSPSNLQEVFAFLFKGLDALEYEEHLDYDIFQASTSALTGAQNDEKDKSIVRVDLFKDRRQTIQYIHPQDAQLLSSAELLIIDECAAIPLPLVRSLIGGTGATVSPHSKYLVFLASTIHGYEGTGRSLSLKLVKELRENTSAFTPTNISASAEEGSSSKKRISGSGRRVLKEVSLTTPIRYATNDKVESWLNALLCFTPPPSSGIASRPHPSQCQLYAIERDTLFSYHPASELFLQRLWSLYVGSHYKNSPNDLMLASDAGHVRLFVLLGPVDEDKGELPEPLAVLHIAHEGNLAPSVLNSTLAGRGIKGDGDLIPWNISTQFQESNFGKLGGVRVVRAAVSPECVHMGYGSRALECLRAFYNGEIFQVDLNESDKGKQKEVYPDMSLVSEGTTLGTDEGPKIRAANEMPPLLQRLEEVKPEKVDWLGVSYGLSGQLLRFWKRAGYIPLYIRQTTSDLTGEHSCIMLRGLQPQSKDQVMVEESMEWLYEFAKDFRLRFLTLLSYKFREFSSILSLSVLETVNVALDRSTSPSLLGSTELAMLLTPFDIRRLQAYSDNSLDWHVVVDLMPRLSEMYFQGRLGPGGGEEVLKLSAVQSAVLLAIGLQRKDVDVVDKELNLPASQILALLTKIIRKLTKRLVDIRKEAIEAELPAAPKNASNRITQLGSGSLMQDVEQELDQAGEELKKAEEEKREQQRELIGSLDLRKYAINDSSIDWSQAEGQVSKITGGGNTVVSLKGSSGGLKRKQDAADADQGGGDKKKNKTRRGGGGKKIGGGR